MSKVVKAEYDAATNTLRFVEPVEGLRDHQRVQVMIDEEPVDRPWLKFSGILSEEDGDDLARAIEEMFPPWTGDDD